MSVAASDLVGLDDKVSVTEAAIERTQHTVHRCRDATVTILWILIILVKLRRMHEGLDWIQNRVPDLSVETDEERRSIRDIAIKLGRVTAALDAVHEEWEDISSSDRSGLFMGSLWSRVAQRLEDLACMSEDIAETLALAADRSFSQRIQEELSRVLPHDG